MERRRLRLPLAALALACLLPACATGPSYEGGPAIEEPHALVETADRVSIWRIDGKASRHRDRALVPPGAHKLKVRIEYSIEFEGEGNFEWKDVDLEARDGAYYVLFAKPDGAGGEERHLDLPPYRIVIQERRAP